MSSSTIDDAQSPKGSSRAVHFELLLSLIGMLVIQSFLSPESDVQRVVFNLLFLGLILSAIRTFSSSRKRLFTAIAFGVIAFAFSWIADWNHSNAAVEIVYCSYILVFILLVTALAESVFRDGPVNVNRIVGAVSIYLVLGILWAFVYCLLETLQPGAFATIAATIAAGDDGGIHARMIGEFMYFSNVTLTTLGYGDIVPVTSPAKTLATLEAITGQLYLTVVMARLVGLHITQNR